MIFGSENFMEKMRKSSHTPATRVVRKKSGKFDKFRLRAISETTFNTNNEQNNYDRDGSDESQCVFYIREYELEHVTPINSRHANVGRSCECSIPILFVSDCGSELKVSFELEC